MPWFVIYTQARSEKKVAERLDNMGIKVYCPMVTQIRQWSDRKKKVESPLISSYVFVNLSDTDREKVFQVPGVVRFLFWLGRPAVVRDSEIESLRESLSGVVSQAEVEAIRPGSAMQIAHGPFQGKQGTVSQVNKNNIRIILEELGIVVTLTRQAV